MICLPISIIDLKMSFIISAFTLTEIVAMIPTVVNGYNFEKLIDKSLK